MEPGNVAVLCKLCTTVIPEGCSHHKCKKCKPWYNVCNECASAAQQSKEAFDRRLEMKKKIRTSKVSIVVTLNVNLYILRKAF